MLPTTKLYKLDLQFIVDNCLNQKLWPKRWLIFEYDKISVVLFIKEIDVEGGKLRLQLRMQTKDKGSFNSHTYILIPLKKSEQNMDNALRQITGGINSLVQDYELHIAQSYKGYERASDLDDLMRTEAQERAIRLLDAEGITNEEIRIAYIDSCRYQVDQNYSGNFLTECLYKTRPQYYLMIAAYFYPENKTTYQNALDKTGINQKTKRFKKYREDMLAFIKAIYNDTVDDYIELLPMEMATI